ncbi:hypothetical protein MRX96_000894 [Rhipicephalus microplus]
MFTDTKLHVVAAVAQNGLYVKAQVDGRLLVLKVGSSAYVLVVPDTSPGCQSAVEKLRSLSWWGRQTNEALYVVEGQEQHIFGYPVIVCLGVFKVVGTVTPAWPETSTREDTPAFFNDLSPFPVEYTIRIKPYVVSYSLSMARRIPIPLRDVVKRRSSTTWSERV